MLCCRNVLSSAGAIALAASLFAGSRASAQPANDLCSGAIALTPGVAAAGNNATATSTGDGPITTACQGGSSVKNGVWYSLTTGPADAGPWRISTCGGPSHDTVLVVYQAGIDCSGIGLSSNFLACNDDNGTDCTGTRASLDATLAASSTYLIRLQTWGSGTSGAYSILANALVPIGTCCNNTTGACTAISSGTCPTGTTAASGTSCTPSSCPAIGVCCNNTTGVCSQLFSGSCATGSTAGSGTTCEASSCPALATCCNDTNGGCTVIYGGACATGTTQTGSGTSCAAGSNPCPPSQACCDGTACTVILVSTGCGSGVGQGAGSTCTPTNICFPADNCETTTQVATLGSQSGSNVNATTTFNITPGSLCPGIVTNGTGGNNDVFWQFTAPATTTYTLDTCAAGSFDTVLSVHSACPATSANVVACNDDSSATGNVTCGTDQGLNSRIQTVSLTAGTLYYIRIGSYLTTTFGAYTLNIAYVDAASVGSCCVSTTCTLTDAANCGGTFAAGGTCSPSPCGGPAGVCCRGATCNITITSAAACTASLIGGQTAGASFPSAASCNTGPVSNAPCCYADYNKTGGVTVTDIFNFLSDWFAGSPYANVGGTGAAGPLSVQNIFDFLNNWFAGGC